MLYLRTQISLSPSKVRTRLTSKQELHEVLRVILQEWCIEVRDHGETIFL